MLTKKLSGLALEPYSNPYLFSSFSLLVINNILIEGLKFTKPSKLPF